MLWTFIKYAIDPMFMTCRHRRPTILWISTTFNGRASRPEINIRSTSGSPFLCNLLLYVVHWYIAIKLRAIGHLLEIKRITKAVLYGMILTTRCSSPRNEKYTSLFCCTFLIKIVSRKIKKGHIKEGILWFFSLFYNFNIVLGHLAFFRINFLRKTESKSASFDVLKKKICKNSSLFFFYTD